MSFVIFTDSSANLPEPVIHQYDLHIVSLTFIVNNEEYLSYTKGETTDLAKFYKMMRNGSEMKTSLVNTGHFMQVFEPLLQEGQDILYIAMSGALSGTYQAGAAAADALGDDYPDRRIAVIDSLSASLGQGLLVLQAAKMREEGKSLDETVKWVSNNRLRMRHHFTVDDLMFLKRGGRIPAATAILGTMLSIKPMLHMDNEGKLTVIGRVRGRRQSLKALVEQLVTHAVDIDKQIIAIAHGDCVEDARYVEELVRASCQPRDIIVNLVDPVLGAHAGPGTMALFFMGIDRQV